MSAEVAVSAEDVSKRFVLRKNRAGDLRELFTGLLRRGDKTSGADDAFYALRDVGFSIHQGETVGIVGHNGSGKSTLLKMLTGILKPDTGHVRTRGRIGALIEVGAGFHPDLSGRENVYLNGSIMGLSRRDLQRKFDAIVAFAGLERFIDTPVKRYSSGMYMRLGFAIATHIDPEILLIDEVLAVGDTQFQNKCVKHLQEFAASGGTVIFVSHAMEQVAGLCERCLWLDRGQLLHDGPTTDAIDKYMAVVAEREDEEFKRTHPEEWEAREAEKRAVRIKEQAKRDAEEAFHRETERILTEERQLKKEREIVRLVDPSACRILQARLLDQSGDVVSRVHVLEPSKVEIAYRFGRALTAPVFCLEVLDAANNLMFATNTYLHGVTADSFGREGLLSMHVPSMSLNEGAYSIRLQLFGDAGDGDFGSRNAYEDRVEEAVSFRVDGGRFGGHGIIYLPVTWEVSATTEKNNAASEAATLASPAPLDH
ncbi:MAG: ATP-binding cassette domain-containing protein [Akkermansiaceae bacterium]|nr:ATP-binding cassette domain-containing protein [Armatimonadota bacterium]